MSAWAADGTARRGGSEHDDEENSDGEPTSEQDGSPASGGGHADGEGGYFCGDDNPAKNEGFLSVLWKIAVCIFTGIAFGFILEKSRGEVFVIFEKKEFYTMLRLLDCLIWSGVCTDCPD